MEGEEDIFDALMRIEEEQLALGHRAGVAHGEAVGREQGHKLGEIKGLHFGTEVTRGDWKEVAHDYFFIASH